MRRAWLLIALAAIGGCERENRRFETPRVAAPDPDENNAYAVSQGHQLYEWFNCVGCHFHGGGGTGPALMDRIWIYGAEPQNVYDSIMHGRPNGMPSFGGKIPEQQAWQLVAYVRSMAGLVRSDVRSARDDHMNTRSSESLYSEQPPTPPHPNPEPIP